MKLIHIFTGLSDYTDKYLKAKIDVAEHVSYSVVKNLPGYNEFKVISDDIYVVRIHKFTCFDHVTDELIALLCKLYNDLCSKESVDCYYINECHNDELASELNDMGYTSMTFKELIDIMEG